jgi:hypothetical protein
VILTLSHFPASYQYGEKYEHEHGEEHHDGAHHALTANWNWLLENQRVKRPGKGQPARRHWLVRDRPSAGHGGGRATSGLLQDGGQQILFMVMHFLQIIEHCCFLRVTI